MCYPGMPYKIREYNDPDKKVTPEPKNYFVYNTYIGIT